MTILDSQTTLEDFPLPSNDLDRPEAANDAAPFRDHTITLSDGRRLAVREFGDPNAPPAFYFHGWPGSRMEPGFFALNGIRIIAIDRPGYGGSCAKPGRKLLDWPNDVAEAADQLGLDRFGIVGMSGGGPYAAACAYALHERVTACTLIAPLGPPEAPGMKSPKIRLMSSVGQRPLTRSVIFHFMRRFILSPGGEKRLHRMHAHLHASKADIDALDMSFSRHILSGIREALRHTSHGLATDANIYGQPWPFALEDIGVPVLLWHGADDEVVPASIGRHYAACIPDSKLIPRPRMKGTSPSRATI